jgi:hypothetical protein
MRSQQLLTVLKEEKIQRKALDQITLKRKQSEELFRTSLKPQKEVEINLSSP